MKHKILVATTNPGKIAELHELLPAELTLMGLNDFGDIAEVPETGETFAENARIKALGYAQATGLVTISDDSGLVIDALGGQPGVKSARFCGMQGPDRSVIDKANIRKVLELMQDVPPEERTARFMCCICMANPQEVLIETQGAVEGVVSTEEVGTGGFGYDPIFLIPSLGRSAAQLGSQEKNAISHRGNAIRKFKPLLEQKLGLSS
jgi:XTP/dITP diphosphohydrolase